jgi:hypothetical protein
MSYQPLPGEGYQSATAPVGVTPMYQSVAPPTSTDTVAQLLVCPFILHIILRHCFRPDTSGISAAVLRIRLGTGIVLHSAADFHLC